MRSGLIPSLVVTCKRLRKQEAKTSTTAYITHRTSHIRVTREARLLPSVFRDYVLHSRSQFYFETSPTLGEYKQP